MWKCNVVNEVIVGFMHYNIINGPRGGGRCLDLEYWIEIWNVSAFYMAG